MVLDMSHVIIQLGRRQFSQNISTQNNFPDSCYISLSQGLNLRSECANTHQVLDSSECPHLNADIPYRGLMLIGAALCDKWMKLFYDGPSVNLTVVVLGVVRTLQVCSNPLSLSLRGEATKASSDAEAPLHTNQPSFQAVHY